MSGQDDIQKLLINHHRRLQLLKEQQALRGLDTPLDVLVEIEDVEAQIQALQKELEIIRYNPATILPGTSIPATALPVSTSLESPYGAMRPDSPFYIERQADNICWRLLNQNYANTIFVRAPRQMGKSSLIERMAYRAWQTYGLPTVFIEFEHFDEQQLAKEDEFLINLCCMIGNALDIPEQIERYWTTRYLSRLQKCSNYISQYLIPTFGQPFILAMDEVERLLRSPFCNDFFGMVRTWHNDRARIKSFNKMTLLISSSTEPHLFIDNPHQSPFNVAQPVSLQDFTLAEVEELNRRHPIPLDPPQVKMLFDLLSGHPFLTRLAFYLLAIEQVKFDDLVSHTNLDTGPFGGHLLHHWQNLLDLPEVRPALAIICRGQTYRKKDKIYYRLLGAGLIKDDNGRMVMRNKLYGKYFSERLDD